MHFRRTDTLIVICLREPRTQAASQEGLWTKDVTYWNLLRVPSERPATAAASGFSQRTSVWRAEEWSGKRVGQTSAALSAPLRKDYLRTWAVISMWTPLSLPLSIAAQQPCVVWWLRRAKDTSACAADTRDLCYSYSTEGNLLLALDWCLRVGSTWETFRNQLFNDQLPQKRLSHYVTENVYF